jgi:hypothetical protein
LLRERLQAARAQLARCSSRYHVAQRRETAKCITEMEARLATLEGGELLRGFEAKVAPYVELVRGMGPSRGGPRPASSDNIRKPRSEFQGEMRVYDEASIRDELAGQLEATPPPVLIQDEDVCPTCNVAMVVMPTEARVGCPECSRTRPYLQATSSHIPYGEEVEFGTFSYKRHNHFQEWLKCIQAKENTEVSSEMINQVMEHLYSVCRIRNTAALTHVHVRRALKEMGLHKQYDHTMQIYVRITGKPAPRFSMFHEQQLRLMFDAMQTPFEKHRPKSRKNFLSYAYCLHKFCQILGLDEFLPYFQLLKCAEKLKKQDAIFKKICAELNWEFIPSPMAVEPGIGGVGTLESFCVKK